MNYYVDSISGSDSNPGTSEDKPWQTLAPVHAWDFLPGDVVSFKRGSGWNGGLVINGSGVESSPITFTTYGIGDRPAFTNPGSPSNWTRAVRIEADWVILEGILTQNAHYAGVQIETGARNNIIRDIEATEVGIGIAIWGQHNLVTRNYLHDLTEVVNTPDKFDDDFGAVGIWLFNSYNEVSYNRMVNCIADSYDYGVDGGAVEWWGDAENNYVHHNWATNCVGFFEIGGGSANNSVVAYNVSLNNGIFACIHLTGIFASTIENFRFENNTIVETEEEGWVIWEFLGADPPDSFSARNNIIYAHNYWHVCNRSTFVHDHNLYYLSGGTQLGFPLGEGEEIADPLFVNMAGQDFHLQPESPARVAGIWLGHSFDFDDKPVTDPPDLGAFQYQEVTEMTIVEMLRLKATELRTMADEIDAAADTLAAIDIAAQAAVVETEQALAATQAVEAAL